MSQRLWSKQAAVSLLWMMSCLCLYLCHCLLVGHIMSCEVRQCHSCEWCLACFVVVLSSLRPACNVSLQERLIYTHSMFLRFTDIFSAKYFEMMKICFHILEMISYCGLRPTCKCQERLISCICRVALSTVPATLLMNVFVFAAAARDNVKDTKLRHWGLIQFWF